MPSASACMLTLRHLVEESDGLYTAQPDQASAGAAAHRNSIAHFLPRPRGDAAAGPARRDAESRAAPNKEQGAGRGCRGSLSKPPRIARSPVTPGRRSVSMSDASACTRRAAVSVTGSRPQLGPKPTSSGRLLAARTTKAVAARRHAASARTDAAKAHAPAAARPGCRWPSRSRGRSAPPRGDAAGEE